MLILAEELDPQTLDDQFRMQMKMNKSISVKDSKFWEKLRYVLPFNLKAVDAEKI